MRRNIYLLLATLAAASLLGGCGFLHKHFDRKEPEYRKSVEEKPLEVPPDLDSPNSSGALVIPPATASSGSSSSASSAATGSAPPGQSPFER